MKMTKVFALTVLASVFAIGTPAVAQNKPEVTLMAVTNNPKNSGHYRCLEIYKKMVEERTKGRVAVQLYSDAVLGDEE